MLLDQQLTEGHALPFEPVGRDDVDIRGGIVTFLVHGVGAIASDILTRQLVDIVLHL